MKIPYTKSGAMVFVNLLISYFIAMMLGIIAVLYLSMDAFSIMTSFKLMLFVLVVVTTAIIATLTLVKKWTHISLINKFINKFKEIKDFLTSIRTSYLILTGFMILLGFFINAWIIKLLINDMGESVTILPLFLIQGIPLLLGSLSMVPMGLGAKDASLAFLLVQLNITPDVALSSALIMRIFVTGFSVLLGVISINYLVSNKIFDRKDIKELSSQQ